jgi:Protein of unknown function (DUF3619)
MNAHPLHTQRLDAVTNRLGLRLAGSLESASRELPHDVAERLRFAREQALARAAQARRLVAAGSVSGQGAAAVLSGPPSLWLRLASLLPLVLLVVGLLLINHRQDMDQIAAAAEIDAVLLADELPPTAYSDPGFNAFLKSGPTP